jgi:hypothetical protein
MMPRAPVDDRTFLNHLRFDIIRMQADRVSPVEIVESVLKRLEKQARHFEHYEVRKEQSRVGAAQMRLMVK